MSSQEVWFKMLFSDQTDNENTEYSFQKQKKPKRGEKKPANLAFWEASHEGAACALVAAGIGFIRCVCPILRFGLSVEEKDGFL